MSFENLPTENELVEFVSTFSKELTVYSRETFDLPSTWVPIVKLDFKNLSGVSYAGTNAKFKPMMKLFLGRFLHTTTNGYPEYASYAAHKRIGNVQTTDWRIHVKALMAHEFSHMVQYSLKGVTNALSAGYNEFKTLGVWEGNHGDFFKNIYVKFRDQFINSLVPPASLGVAVDFMEVEHTHEFVGQTYISPSRGKLVVMRYLPRARKWKLIAQCPITEVLYKTSIERVAESLQRLKSSTTSSTGNL